MAGFFVFVHQDGFLQISLCICPVYFASFLQNG